MVNLEQIRLLESRVQKAIQYIQKLREENRSLRASLSKYEQRIGDLEGMVGDFKTGQDEIEQSITNALKQLDKLEDELLEEPEGSNGPKGTAVKQSPSPDSEQAAAKAAGDPSAVKESRGARPEKRTGDQSSVRTEHDKRTGPADAEGTPSDDDFVAEPVDPEDSELLRSDAPKKDTDAESELDIF